jgi:transcriptional regulator with XRE-family HTH domain
MREFPEYFASSHESLSKLPKRARITNVTLRDLLSGNRQPAAKTLAKLRRFLDVEGKRNRAGTGSVGLIPLPIKPLRYLLYTRLSPLCRKARGKIRTIIWKQFQGVCRKCGAGGPNRESASASADSVEWESIKRLQSESCGNPGGFQPALEKSSWNITKKYFAAQESRNLCADEGRSQEWSLTRPLS